MTAEKPNIDVEKIVLDILKDITPESDFSSIDPDKNLNEQIEIDSMDFLDIVMEIRKRQGIEVPEQDYKHLTTLNSCIDYLTPKIEEKYKK
jgi:acyl carrier protein